MRTTSFRKRSSLCTNCGLDGHQYRQCTAPITSYGIIAVRNKSDVWDPSSLEVLMIQRRDSIGFIELLRAKYKLTDIEYIKQQLEGTTVEEREKLRTQTFHDLWVGLWGTSPKENKQYKQEFDQAAYKFTQLKTGYIHEDQTISLESLLATTPVIWNTPEWGFPKGRRNQYESDKQCACREFREETGLTEDTFTILDTIDPIRETFYGNNGIHYCHVYFLALVHVDTEVTYDATNEHMKQEIGGLGWFSVQEAFQKIRTTNPEKRAILTRADRILKTILPVCLGGGVVFGWKKKLGEVDRSVDGRGRIQSQLSGASRRTRRVWKTSITSSWFKRGSTSIEDSASSETNREWRAGDEQRGGEPGRGESRGDEQRGGEPGGEPGREPGRGESGGDEQRGGEPGGEPTAASRLGSTSSSVRSTTTIEQSGGEPTSTNKLSDDTSSSSDSSNTNPWITATSRSTRKHKPLQRLEQSTTCEFLED